MTNVSGTEVRNFYDDFTKKQVKSGVNTRHRRIMNNLKKSGLKKSAHVLEIGCGIGTLTSLIASHLSNGKILAADISPESIEIARKSNQKFGNCAFIVSDMSDFNRPEKFDWVVLPDVLEHIPIEQHANLFRVIREHLKPDGTVFINIPHPRMLTWVHQNKPELLQIIDQPLHTDQLLKVVYSSDLYLETLISYSLSYQEYDYQYLILKPNKPLDKVEVKSGFRLMAQSVLSRIGF